MENSSAEEGRDPPGPTHAPEEKGEMLVMEVEAAADMDHDGDASLARDAATASALVKSPAGAGASDTVALERASTGDTLGPAEVGVVLEQTSTEKR